MNAPEVELLLVALAAMLSPTTLSFSVLALVLGERPLRTGVLFYAGALGATLTIGGVAAFVIGGSAASQTPNTPKAWVAIVDLIAGTYLLAFVWRTSRRPPSPVRIQKMIDQMSRLASSPAIAVVAAGATLANPGGFIPIALKDISETNPSASQYVLQWLAFTLISLLPLSVALLALAISPAPTSKLLSRTRSWLERRARTVAAAILLLLAVSLLRAGVAGLTA